MNLKRTKLNGYALFMMVFESVMSVFYLLLAYILIFTEWFEATISNPFRLPLGALFALYGFYRVYRAIKKLITTHKEE